MRVLVRLFRLIFLNRILSIQFPRLSIPGCTDHRFIVYLDKLHKLLHTKAMWNFCGAKARLKAKQCLSNLVIHNLPYFTLIIKKTCEKSSRLIVIIIIKNKKYLCLDGRDGVSRSIIKKYRQAFLKSCKNYIRYQESQA